MKHLSDPWQTEGDRLASVLDEVRDFLCRFVAFTTEAQPVAVALWIAHTYVIAACDDTPRLSIRSAEMRSGKTRLLECIELLAYEPMLVVNMSEAAVFRTIADGPVTVLWDEVDATFSPDAHKEDLRALINAGYRRGAVVVRMMGDGKKMRIEKFPVFAPMALTGLGRLPGTIEDRSIIIRLRRRHDEPVTKLRHRHVAPEAAALAELLAEACGALLDDLPHRDPKMPDGLNDRAEDCWAPLLAIADAAGHEWATRARSAAVALLAVNDEMSYGLQLLADVREVFEERDATRLTPSFLADALAAIDISPWAAFGRNEKLITANKVSRMLSEYGIKSRPARDGKARGRYFRAEDFADAWDRYLPPRENSGDTLTTQTGYSPYGDTIVNVSTQFSRGGGERGADTPGREGLRTLPNGRRPEDTDLDAVRAEAHERAQHPELWGWGESETTTTTDERTDR
jgi:hypothetical protein